MKGQRMKSMKKLVSCFLALLLLAGVIAAPAALADVPDGSAEANSRAASEKNLLSGLGVKIKNLLAVLTGNAREEGESAQAELSRVVCVDAGGAPVAGARVQLCTDELCIMGVTDENGTAVFDVGTDHGATVRLFKPPDGYAEDDTEYPVPENADGVTIILKTA